MAYRFDAYDSSIVIDGWGNGIAANPYDGISDARNILINTVPGEVSVGFATGSNSVNVSVGTMTGFQSGGTTVVFTGAANIWNGATLTFGTVSGFSGISAGTAVYFIKNLSGTPPVQGTLYSDFAMTSIVTVSGSGTAAFTVYNPDFTNYAGFTPQRFCRSNKTGNRYLIDSKGICWTDQSLFANGNWRHVGNARHSASFIGDTSNGNGIVYVQPTPTAGNNLGNGYVFLFSDSSIDYFTDVTGSIAMNYGWNPADATKNNAIAVLNSGQASGNSHDALVAQDNVVYYCDGNAVGSFAEKAGQTFDPSQISTYTPTKRPVSIPPIDNAQCLAELGTDLLIGGTRNFIYPWNRLDALTRYPILLSESVVQRMVTVKTNTYAFVGNRGRIHITNGSQAEVWLKVPDHLSGTVEPYFRWGGVATQKNQLYFSVWATTNGDSNFAAPLSQYGGIWAIDLTSEAMRMTSQLSYGTYGGYAPALHANVPLYNADSLIIGNSGGSSLAVGWFDGVSTSGIDTSSSNPFTNSQAYVDSDLIPIGTFTKPRTFQRIEYLLTKPLVAGESITLQYRTDFSQSFTTIATDSTAGNYANTFPTNWNYSQWVQIRAVLNSTNTNPSYVRLKHIRITGIVQ